MKSFLLTVSLVFVLMAGAQARESTGHNTLFQLEKALESPVCKGLGIQAWLYRFIQRIREHVLTVPLATASGIEEVSWSPASKEQQCR